MSHLSKISISIFLHHFLKTPECFILMQTPLQLDIWFQSYEVFDNAKTIWNKGILTLFLPISKKRHPRHPTHSSWSCHNCSWRLSISSLRIRGRTHSISCFVFSFKYMHHILSILSLCSFRFGESVTSLHDHATSPKLIGGMGNIPQHLYQTNLGISGPAKKRISVQLSQADCEYKNLLYYMIFIHQTLLT